ncbi:glycosyltransferase [Bacillus sp. CFBP 13597]|nr:glycosyltransferase [Bacillus sp. CFBP 13597]
MINVAMVIPNWGKECGVAEYTNQLVNGINDQIINVKIITNLGRLQPINLKYAGIDMVHFQYEYSMYNIHQLKNAMKILMSLKIPIITTVHSWSHEMKHHNSLISFFSTCIIVHSNQFKKICIKDGVSKNKLVVIPMGCPDISINKPLNFPSKNPPGYPRIGFFGFPFPNKGISQLIEAIKELNKGFFPEIEGHFFSHLPNSIEKTHSAIPYQNELENKFKQFNYLYWYKEYLPQQSLVESFQAMDVFVLPYIQYGSVGISSAVKFLFNAEKPIITTESLQFSDLTNEVYKISNSEPSFIADAIYDVLTNENLRNQLLMNANSFKRINSWKSISNQYCALYLQLKSNSKKS